MGRILGIDYGFKRIGLALSDPSKIIASPLTIVATQRRLQQTALTIQQAVTEKEIEQIVIGFPYRLQGGVGALGDEVRLIASELEKLFSVPVIQWDERFTTVQAERALKEAHMNRKKRAKVVDKVAAVLILQSYLDCQSASLALSDT